MSKKSRRVKAKSQAATRSPKRDNIKRAEPVKKKAETNVPISQPGTATATLTQQNRYYYILPELRRIAIIAGALIVILIILTFVLG